MRELHALQMEALSLLPTLKANTRMILGENDHIVGPDCKKIFLERKKLGYNEVVEVEGATHFMMYDPDPNAEDEAMSQVVSWMDA